MDGDTPTTPAAPAPRDDSRHIDVPASAPGPLSERIARQKASERMILLVVRALFLVLLATVTTLTIASRVDPNDPASFSTTTVIGIIVSTMAVGIIVLAVDYMTPNKRLASVVGVYLGVCVGLLGAIAVARLIDVVANAWGIDRNTYIDLAKVVVGIVLCYLAVSFVLTTKDNFRLVIPYVEFAKQMRGIRPMALDTSVLVDGRIEQMVQAGFIDAPIVIPTFVVEELQALSDSSDRLKRQRGRRGLDVVTRLQTNGVVDVSIEDVRVPGHSVDRMLVELAGSQQMRLLTTDYNLVKVAKINGVSALNLNDLASGLKTVVVPGEPMRVEIVREGENEGQGVGYMPDGTMVVVDQGASHLGEIVDITVTNSLQTSAGRMIFARIEGRPGSPAEAAAQSATHQPRFTGRPDREGHPTAARRNPRR
jgi:uncharacterized protein YacL